MGVWRSVGSGEGSEPLPVSEFGPVDGSPLVAFHGTPDSRQVWSMMAEDAERVGVRLVAFDRPGFGDRPFVPGSTALDSARDAGALADGLGFDRFSVIGISGGAVHALATGHELAERVERITILSGWCLLSDEGRAAMQPALRINVGLVERQSRLATLIAATMVGLVRRSPALASRLLVRSRPAGDRKALSLDRFDHLRTSLSAQFVSPDAIVDGIAQQLGPWPFDLAAITQPVAIWQGGQDDVHPPAMGRYLEAALPNARLHLEPDRCTFDFYPLFERILESAV